MDKTPPFVDAAFRMHRLFRGKEKGKKILPEMKGSLYTYTPSIGRYSPRDIHIATV